jgi:hypothetical protein
MEGGAFIDIRVPGHSLLNIPSLEEIKPCAGI